MVQRIPCVAWPLRTCYVAGNQLPVLTCFITLRFSGCEVILFKLAKSFIYNTLMFIAGGGVALLHASEELEKLQAMNIGEKIGVKLLQHAVKVFIFIFCFFQFFNCLFLQTLAVHQNHCLFKTWLSLVIMSSNYKQIMWDFFSDAWPKAVILYMYKHIILIIWACRCLCTQLLPLPAFKFQLSKSY